MSDRIELFVFAVLSVPVIVLSWRSLLHPRSHGFSRFFAFEAILGLLVTNLPHWFGDALVPRQLVSWALLLASLVCLIWGLALLRQEGGFDPRAELSAAYGWERTAKLVTRGIFRYIRHPMYASLLFLAWGAYLKNATVPALALAVAGTVALFFTARAEEAENLARFGDEYRAYMARTRRFVPYLF
jgi:protein-S-isoprenylcysteine O-methyltransferase Ste14